MRTHRLFTSLRQAPATTKLTCALIALIAVTCLPVRAPAQSTCTGTFAGDWSWPKGNDTLVISLQGDTAEGVLRSSVKLKGTVTNGVLAGDWADQVDATASGTFRVELFSAEHRIRISLYNKQQLVEGSDFFCQPAQSPQTTGPGQGPKISLGSLFKKDDNHDTDNFRTFDALPKAEQEKQLAKNGPRLPSQYPVNALSLRAFVRGGWPVVLDYGLDQDAYAELSISAEGVKPLLIRIDPAKRAQVRITLPDSFGMQPQVGKLRIVALKKTGEPAKFFLYGFAMGVGGVEALRKVSPPSSGGQLAMMGSSPGPASGYGESIPLFAPINPQGGSIQVAPPTRIKPKQKPKQLVRFSFTFHSNFNGGRWEMWHDSGSDLTKVWENTIRSIAPNQTVRDEWDGIIKLKKQVLVGEYVLQLNAWRGLRSDPDWAFHRTSSAITIDAPR